MKYETLKEGVGGFDRAQTLDEIEAIREAAYAAIATGYHAGPRDRASLFSAVYAREDIDRAADKARERVVHVVLASLGRKAA